jgi:hypothetical protein
MDFTVDMAKWKALPKHLQEMVTATRQHSWDQYAYIQKGNVQKGNVQKGNVQKGNVADRSMCRSGGLVEERVRELLAARSSGWSVSGGSAARSSSASAGSTCARCTMIPSVPPRPWKRSPG